MITLSNGHKFEYMVASGALGFDGLGWWWERPLVWLGLIKPELFTVVLKTLTKDSRKGNLNWWKPWTWLPFSPWSCVRLLRGGLIVNKVGLTNPGINFWFTRIGPKLNFRKYNLVASIFGTEEELVYMAIKLDDFDFVAIEVNPSCPNTGHKVDSTETIINSVKAVKRVSRHPIIVKISVEQDYIAIADGLKGVAEAISLNSVPWKIVFSHGEVSPLEKIGQPNSGGGGVSGYYAKGHNWQAVRGLCKQGSLPIIAPSIMEYQDLRYLKGLGVLAFSFGSIHLKTPWKPTQIVEKEMKNE